MGMNILSFPMSPKHVLDLIQDAAANHRIIYPTFENASGMYALITRRQVQKCLMEGDLVDAPVVDQEGNVDFSISALCSGLDVTVSAKLRDMGGWYIIVIHLDNKL